MGAKLLCMKLAFVWGCGCEDCESVTECTSMEVGVGSEFWVWEVNVVCGWDYECCCGCSQRVWV